MKRASTMEVKRQNRNNVYRIIYQKGKISKQEIANKLNLSLPTVAQNLTELFEKGLIYENGSFDSTGGRKAKGISCNMDAKTAIGLDITRNHISGVLVNLLGEVLYSIRTRLHFEDNRKYYEELRSLVDRIIEEGRADPYTILGIGISMPGIIGADHKTITYAPVVETTTLFEDLKGYLPYPYAIINDAKAGGFAELWHSPHAENMVYLSLSNSVGGAVLMNNELYYGDQRLSGEIGHMTLEIDGKPCYCGKKGCMDPYCNAQLLSRRTGGDLKKFFELLDKGDKDCRQEWETYLKYLSVAINNLRNCLDCEVILGGYVGSYMDSHIDELRQMVIKRSTFTTDGKFVQSCAFKFESSAVGAGLYYIDEYIKGI